MSFPERLVERRESLGISQKELASRLNITPTRLNYWEKGKREPDVFYIKAIAKELDVTGDWLLETGFEDQYRPSLDALEIAKQYDHLEPDGKQFIQMAMKFAQRPNFPPFGGSGARYKISVGTEPSAAEQMISLDSVEHNPEGKNI